MKEYNLFTTEYKMPVYEANFSYFSDPDPFGLREAACLIKPSLQPPPGFLNPTILCYPFYSRPPFSPPYSPPNYNFYSPPFSPPYSPPYSPPCSPPLSDLNIMASPFSPGSSPRKLFLDEFPRIVIR